jgi:hypothetical protein
MSRSNFGVTGEADTPPLVLFLTRLGIVFRSFKLTRFAGLEYLLIQLHKHRGRAAIMLLIT